MDLVFVEVVIVSKVVRLPGWEYPAVNAAQWLREHLSIPEYEMLEKQFCDYFNCKLHKEYDQDYPIPKTYIEFFNEKDAIMIALRWA